MKKTKQKTYKFLKTGFFSFPLKDLGKKFIVKDTYTLELKDKSSLEEYELADKLQTTKLYAYSKLFWKAIKKEKLDKKFKNNWIVPISMNKIGNIITLEVDILKKV